MLKYKSFLGISPKSIKILCKRFCLSAGLITKTERVLLYIIIGLISFLVAYKGYEIYLNSTVAVPASGGVYKEITISEVKYLNPILAKTDAERAISRLLYSGLVKIDENGNIAPDLAEKWEIMPDNLTYRFNLKNSVYFHNGETFEAKDVINTIEAIKNPATKSPYREIWSEVVATSPENNIVDIKIPRQNGAFVFNCLQGIVASNNIAGSIAEIVNGTGLYHLKVLKDLKNNSKYIELENFNFYYGIQPQIPKMQFTIYATNIPDEEKNTLNSYTASSGFESESVGAIKQDFKVGRSLMLVPNLKKPLLADATNRAKAMKFEKFDEPVKLKLISLDAKKQRSKIDEIEKNIQDKNIELEVQLLSSVDFYKKSNERDFDLMLYGADFGYDRDPYAFWHSSQLSKNNYASYANKALDIKLEDARMILNYADRNTKYDEIVQQLVAENLVNIYPTVTFNFAVNQKIKGIGAIVGNRPEDRYNSISNWYLEEKRVRK